MKKYAYSNSCVHGFVFLEKVTNTELQVWEHTENLRKDSMSAILTLYSMQLSGGFMEPYKNYL